MCRMHRVAIDYPSSPLRHVYGTLPASVVLNDAVWQMETNPEWAEIESSKLLCLSMTHIDIPLNKQAGDRGKVVM